METPLHLAFGLNLLVKNIFLTIELSPESGFGHQTLKPNIFDHPTIKTGHIWSLRWFQGQFLFLIIIKNQFNF